MIEDMNLFEEEDIAWVHNPKQKHKEPSKLVKSLNAIDVKIKKVQNEILSSELKKTAEKIVEIIDMDEEEMRKVFFVNFSKGQTLDLEGFIRELHEGCLEKWSTTNMTLMKVNEDDIMGILLKIYTYIEESDGSHIIFLIQRITNFDYKDIRTLRRSLERGRYSIVIPTYKSLIEVDSLNYSGFYHMTLYNHKQLLVEFMVRVVQDSTIKAYLPKEILQLISDLDYYPISYRESVRRFLISLKKYHVYNSENNIKMVPVEFAHLYEAIVDVLKSCIPRGDVKIEDRFIKTVLDKDFVFKIPKSIVEMVVIKEEKVGENIDVNNYSNLDRIISKMKKKLESQPLLSKYSEQIGQFTEVLIQNPGKNSKNPRDRMAALEIPKSVVGKSQQLNKQITKMIHEVTEKVRQQAERVPWEEISYDELCRPQLSLQICNDVQQDPKLMKIFQSSNKHYQVFHRDNFSQFDMKISQYHYLMTELQYLGLAENSKKQIDPTFYNQVYKKADYRVE